MAVGAAIGSVVGGLASASASSKAASAQADAASDAAEAQLQAARESNELQRDIYNSNLTLYQPQWQSGIANQAALNYALGTGANPNTLSYTYASPLSSDGGASNVVQYVPGSSGSSGGRYYPGGSTGNGSSARFSYNSLDDAISDAGNWYNAYENRLGGGGSYRTGGGGGGSEGYYKVGDNTFRTREEAQAYLDRQTAGNTFTPTYNGYAPMKEYFADLKNLDNFYTSPDYQWRLSEGTDAMKESAAASGLRLSGQALKAVGDYSSNLADNEYTDYYNRGAGEYYNWLNMLQGQSAQLPSTTNALASTGTNYANSVSNNLTNAASGAANAYQNAGAATASGYTGAASALNGTLNNLGSAYMMKQMGMFG